MMWIHDTDDHEIMRTTKFTNLRSFRRRTELRELQTAEEIRQLRSQTPRSIDGQVVWTGTGPVSALHRYDNSIVFIRGVDGRHAATTVPTAAKRAVPYGDSNGSLG